MCQRASGKRSSGKKLTLPLRYLRSVDGSVELRFCPVMGKLPTDETSASEDSSSETCPSSASLHTHDEKQHSCFICSHFQSNLKEEEEAFFPKLHFSSTLPALINVLRRSTQPAHLVVMAATIVLAMLYYPISKPSLPQLQLSSDSKVWPLIYLASFSTLFGAQMWMTFVSGLVLLFILPRHTFACVQSALFPKYMILNGIAAITALTAFLQIQRQHDRITWSYSQPEVYQVAGLAVNCLCPLIARVLVVPSLLKRIKTKVILERAAGHGPEAGPRLTSDTGALLKSCPVYNLANTRFRRLHAVVGIVNIVTLGFNAFHLYYLASKITFHP